MMKHTKKWLSAALVLALTLSLGAPALAASRPAAPAPLVLESASLNGAPLATGPITALVEEQLLLLPLRQVAEALGFAVTWIASESAVELSDGIVKTKIYLGRDSYYLASATAIGMSKPAPLGAAPRLLGDKTYVPAALFELLYGKDSAVTIQGTALHIARGEHLLKTTVLETKVDGIPVNLASFVRCFDGKNNLVPLKTLAMLFSFKVTKTAGETSYLLDNGTVQTTVYMGVDSYFKASSKAIGMTRPVALGSAPCVIGETVYVPAALFDLLCGEGAVTFDGPTMLVKTK